MRNPVGSECGAVAVGCTYLLPPLSPGGASGTRTHAFTQVLSSSSAQSLTNESNRPKTEGAKFPNPVTAALT
jgi:hypothetical protein